MVNIASALRQSAQQRPEAVALVTKKIFGRQQWTFAQIEANTASYAHFLRSEAIGKDDRVMLMVKPSMEFICLTFALFAVGATVILIDPGMGYKNLLRCIGAVKPDILIGIPKALIFSRLFPAPFATVKKTISVGFNFGLLGKQLAAVKHTHAHKLEIVASKADDLAAIIFTTGSTGPPKGVRYEHRIFQAQLERIRDFYKIAAGDIDQPAFPLFALFSIALGACAVIPDMDPTRPAQVNPQKFIRTITDYKVTYSFGSPAIWNVISRYCLDNDIKLPTVKKVLMAGAPVSGELVERVQAILPPDAVIHTPYGATESLPIVSITGSEIVTKTWAQTKKGLGTCVGYPLPGTLIRIIKPVDRPLANFSDALCLQNSAIGEIIVKGEVVTRAYDNNEAENKISKIADGAGFWHRIGDMGYVDNDGRLWFCGRKAHRVLTEQGAMYSVCCEAIFNEHPLVYRSALVGVGSAGVQQPVIIVELFKNKKSVPQNLFADLRQLALQYKHTSNIRHFMVHEAFPVDIRHNAKIFREKLALWAADRLDI